MDKTIETKSLSNFRLIAGEITIWNKRYIELQLSAPFHTIECTVLPTAGVISLREQLPDQASSAVTSPCRVLTMGDICHSQDSNPVPLRRGGCRWPIGLPQLVI
ncbi:hypothetical protein Hanom_Chr08g00701581 [Helianthus anomalus]